MKLKVKSDKRKVRRIFLRTKKESEAFINAILKAQGYASQLMQYRIKREIERTQQSAVMYAKHKLFGTKVVIKSVPSEQYHTRASLPTISEVDA